MTRLVIDPSPPLSPGVYILYLRSRRISKNNITALIMEGVEKSFPIEYDLYKYPASLISLVPLSGVLLPKLMKLRGNFERRFNAALVEIYGVGIYTKLIIYASRVDA